MGHGAGVVDDVGVRVEGVVGRETGEGLGDTAEGVVGGVHETGGPVDGADPGGQVPGVGADAVGWGVDGGDGAVAGGGVGEPGGDEGSGVVAGQRTGGDAPTGECGAGDAVEAEDPPVVPGGVVGEEVPEVAGGDQVLWFDATWGGRAGAGGVIEGEDLVVAAGDGEKGEQGGVGARSAGLPGRVSASAATRAENCDLHGVTSLFAVIGQIHSRSISGQGVSFDPAMVEIMTSDMTARMLRLLSLLQTRREWSGADLADRLGVTVRTVRPQGRTPIGRPGISVARATNGPPSGSAGHWFSGRQGTGSRAGGRADETAVLPGGRPELLSFETHLSDFLRRVPDSGDRLTGVRVAVAGLFRTGSYPCPQSCP